MIIARKLLCIAFAVWTTGQSIDPQKVAAAGRSARKPPRVLTCGDAAGATCSAGSPSAVAVEST